MQSDRHHSPRLASQHARRSNGSAMVVPNLPILNDIWVALSSGICLFEVHQSRRKRGEGEGEGHVAAGTSSMADLVFQLGIGRNRVSTQLLI